MVKLFYRSIVFVLLVGLVFNSSNMCAGAENDNSRLVNDNARLVDALKPLVYLGTLIICLKYEHHQEVRNSTFGALVPLLSVVCLFKFIDSLE